MGVKVSDQRIQSSIRPERPNCTAALVHDVGEIHRTVFTHMDPVRGMGRKRQRSTESCEKDRQSSYGDPLNWAHRGQDSHSGIFPSNSEEGSLALPRQKAQHLVVRGLSESLIPQSDAIELLQWEETDDGVRILGK